MFSFLFSFFPRRRTASMAGCSMLEPAVSFHSPLYRPSIARIPFIVNQLNPGAFEKKCFFNDALYNDELKNI